MRRARAVLGFLVMYSPLMRCRDWRMCRMDVCPLVALPSLVAWTVGAGPGSAVYALCGPALDPPTSTPAVPPA